MASLLEEVIRRKENEEPLLSFIIKWAIQEAYYFEINHGRAQEFFRKYFACELAECVGKKKDVIERIVSLQAPTSCMYFKTDSSSTETYNKIFAEYMSREAKSFGFDDHSLRLCFAEAYSNAVLHGNKGGEESCYEIGSRCIPRPTDIEENRKKLIEIEFLINNQFYFLRITDVGEGVDKSKILPGKNGDTLSFSGRGLFIINAHTDCFIFNKQDEPKRFSISMVKFKE
ncbi:ATP-binding protein [Candidatus Woesearchaeota archaeon]|nr:ATP-binding protein [Candidatus Woesearchaeota archaeon]